MSKQRSSPALARARAYVEKHIADRSGSPNARLGTLHQLAAEAGVGMVTMSRAVAALRTEGLLTVSRGRGIHVAADRQGTAEPPEMTPQWQRIRRSIRGDVLNGVLAPGERLPSIKELRARYGAGYKSLRRALGSLHSDRVIEPFGGGYRAAGLSRRSPRNKVVLIAGGAPNGDLMQYTSRTSDNLRALDNECVNADLQLAICPFNVATRELHAPRGRRALERTFESALGFVVMSAGLYGTDVPNVLSQVARYGRPVAIFAEGGISKLPNAYEGQPGIAQFACGHNTRPGYQVGKFLLGLGHRNVAYLSPMHDSAWSHDRLAGLRSCYCDAGLPDAVSAHVSQVTTGRFGEPERDTQLNAIIRDLKRVRALLTQANLHAQRELISKDMVPLMEQALSDNAATAWVAGNDHAALECLDYLTEKGIRVPDRLSLVGFDNSLDAFYQKISSFSFNSQAVVRAVLQHIIRPHRGRRGKVVEIEGRVMMRESVAAASREL